MGVEKIAYLIKKSDLDESATTYTKPKITKIALKSGKRAYRFSIPSKTPYNGLIYEDQNAEIGIAINKTLPLRMLADSPANSQNIEAFKNEDWVAVYENKAKGADGSQAFCVIGYEQGASMQNATLDKYGDGYNGGWGGDLIEQNAPDAADLLRRRRYRRFSRRAGSIVYSGRIGVCNRWTGTWRGAHRAPLCAMEEKKRIESDYREVFGRPDAFRFQRPVSQPIP